jgi:hypothetical protein
MERTKTVVYELACLPKHRIELDQQKRKIARQKDDIHKLREVIRDLRIIIADAKQKGFTKSNRGCSDPPGLLMRFQNPPQAPGSE